MVSRPDASQAPSSKLQCRDEVLQVLFWLAGEGFETEMTPEGIARFVAWPEVAVRMAIEETVELGLVARSSDGARYELTEAGRREGGRRFAEEFAGTFAHDQHGGLCSDPSCDCHTSPDPGAACGHHHAHGDHP